jgi:hypothetical protein
MSKREPCFVYVVSTAEGEAPCKIGISFNPQARLSALQCGYPKKLVIAHIFRLPNVGAAREIETMLLQIERENRLVGEWLDLKPEVAVQKIAVSIGCAMVAAGIDGEDLETLMRECGALPESGALLPNHGNLH